MIQNAKEAHDALDDLAEQLWPLQLMPKFFVAFRDLRAAIGRASVIEAGWRPCATCTGAGAVLCAADKVCWGEA